MLRRGHVLKDICKQLEKYTFLVGLTENRQTKYNDNNNNSNNKSIHIYIYIYIITATTKTRFWSA